jgi:hypothetical protein
VDRFPDPDLVRGKFAAGFAVLVCAVSSCGTPAAQATPSPGSLLSRFDSGSHGSVFFVSESVGWELTVPPDRLRTVVFRTSDGGLHWHLWGIAPEVAQPQAFSADEVVLNDSAALVTSLDGTTWSVRPLPIAGSVSLLPDLQHGWAYGALPAAPPALPTGKGGPPSITGVWSTADGGATWHEQASGYIGDGSGQIAFWTATTGAILQGVNALLTHDGGVTWHQVALTTLPTDSFAGASPPTMFDAMHGVLEVTIDGSALYVSSTSDGGLTWSPAQSFPGCLVCDGGQVFFLDEQRMIGLKDGVFLSDDAGQSWKRVTTTLPGKTVSGAELVAGVPGAAIVFAPGVFASETTDWGLHWKAIGLPDIYPSYSGFGGEGGWQNQGLI